jgi:membrane-associated phospholipid phosphatase
MSLLRRGPAGPPGSPAAAVRGHPRLLLAGSLVYLGLVFGVMLWRGIEIEPQWVALALLVIAVAVGRGKQFIFDFFPFLLLFFAYEIMRGFASKTGFAPHDMSVLERALFAGHVPTLVLQGALYQPDRIGWLDLAGMFFYFMHFVLPVAMGFVFWLHSRQLYWRFASALLLLSFLAFVTYLFFASTPPWLQFPHEVHKVSDETVYKLHLGYFVSPLYSHLDPNRYAAFPSLHAAYPVLAAVYAWGVRRWLSMLLVGWAACVWFSVVYLGEHYVVDALDGLVYVAAAVLVVELVRHRLERRAGPELAGTGAEQEPGGRDPERDVSERDQGQEEHREHARPT